MHPHDSACIATGLAVILPANYYGYLSSSSSGLALKHNVYVGGGIIVSGHHICVILCNLSSDRSFHICQGDHIAQLKIEPAVAAHFPIIEFKELQPHDI